MKYPRRPQHAGYEAGMAAESQMQAQEHTTVLHASWIISHARQAIHDVMLLENRDEAFIKAYGATLGTAKLPLLTAALCRAIVYQVEIETSHFASPPSESELNHDLHRMRDTMLRDCLKLYIQSMERDEFPPEELLPSVQEYLKLQQEEGIAPRVQEQMNAIHHELRMNSFNLFQKIRRANYEVVNAREGNYLKFLTDVEDVYEQAVLKDAHIEILQHGSLDQQEALRKQTEKGIFVNKFRDPIGVRSSVLEQMEEDFSRDIRQGDPTYEARVLRDDHGNILSWITYEQTPKNPNISYIQRIKRYLHKGVTGGKMHYTSRPSLKHFNKDILPFIQLLDTLQGVLPGAASRLFYKATQDMIKDNDDLAYLIGYRLLELHADPPFKNHKRPVRFWENMKSDEFFRHRGCGLLAEDYSKRGPAAIRCLQDGTEVQIRPAWMSFFGPMHHVYDTSWKLWRAHQSVMGDISEDGFDEVFHSEVIKKNSYRGLL